MGSRETGFFDGTEIVLKLLYIVVKSHEETFGMDGVHEDALTNGGALLARQSLCEIDDELRGGVGYYRQVAIGALGYLVADGEVKILCFLAFLSHVVF